MSNNKIVTVFFACDDNFVKFTMVTVRSMLENASKDYHYNIYILNTNIMDRMKKASFDIVDEYDNATLEFVDVTSYLESISDRLPIRDYYSKTTYYRLFIAEMFPQYDKAIYLDSDMIVKGEVVRIADFGAFIDINGIDGLLPISEISWSRIRL